MKYARRRDANEPQIIAALEAVGAVVQRLDGSGLPDLLCSYKNTLYLIEIKNPKSNKNATHNDAGMTPAQVKWFAKWRDKGGNAPCVVENADEALRAVGARKDEP